MGKWGWAGTPPQSWTALTCSCGASVAENLLPRHHTDICWSQKTTEQESLVADSAIPLVRCFSTGVCVQSLKHPVLDCKTVHLYSTGQCPESFSGLITRISRYLFISVHCSQLLHATGWTHLPELPLYFKDVYICPSWRSKLWKFIGIVMTNSNALLYMDLDVRIVSLWPCSAPTSAGAELGMEQEKQ